MPHPLPGLWGAQGLTDTRRASPVVGPLPSPRADSVCPPGLDIHFIHVKPPQPPSGCTPKPLLMVHGWPGSFYEFYKIIPLLTDPRKHGLSDEHVFEVICPCIPGYGFSEASSKKGTVVGWRGAAAGGQVFPQVGRQPGQLPSEPGGPDGQRPFSGFAGCCRRGMGRAAVLRGQCQPRGLDSCALTSSPPQRRATSGPPEPRWCRPEPTAPSLRGRPLTVPDCHADARPAACWAPATPLWGPRPPPPLL